ncbi:MAG: twin-arginine translocase subunit TatC [Flexistipes sinusarabici]|uniref:Sec-independent protein translocase protein TatC n=1 Tax=Flexistipes sinusarabici TaxID=2352 RepID=A0A5D0MHF5_FLESI|nr:twin-arginine translocase subunit TatC [Flexistipes sinusarabici]TYB33107.1 MAG: twin-arginine translocase subunit TatC [Flexistipes sinusarabici]
MAGIEDKIPLTAHLEELRSRLIKIVILLVIIFSFCYWQSAFLLEFVTKPVVKHLPPDSSMAMLKLTEGFFTELKLSLMAAVFFGMPYILYQLWKFVAPGLYAHEKKYVVSFVIVSSFLFFLGAAFAYYIVFPFGFKFFLNYAKGDVIASLSLQWYLSFVVRLILGFGIIFELPVFVLFLSKMGLLTADFMRKNRRYAIVLLFIVSAIFTPPDVFTQMMMAGPLILLYEISVYIAKIFGRKSDLNEDDIYE